MSKKYIKKAHYHYIIFLTLLILLWLQPFAWGTPRTLVILIISDLHGQIHPIITVKNNATIERGGASRLAAAIASEKKAYPDSVLVVSTGDSLTGAFFHHFKGRAIFSAMTRMGVDVGTLGNHEFDRDIDTLAKA